MSPIDIENARISLKYGLPDLALALETPVSTVRDWFSGRTRIPGAAKVAIELLQRKDQWDMANIKAGLDRKLDRSVSARWSTDQTVTLTTA